MVQNQKKKMKSLFHPETSRVQREVIITTVNQIGDDLPNDVASDKILETINQTLKGTFRVMIAKVVIVFTIILETPIRSKGKQPLNWKIKITNALISLGVTTTKITANSRMTKFTVHGIPTDIGSNLTEAGMAVAEQIRADRRQLPLAQIQV